jgi:hypothetical protein
MRLQAANTLLALAGVRAPSGEEDKPASDDKKPPAVLLNLFLGGSKSPRKRKSLAKHDLDHLPLGQCPVQ